MHISICRCGEVPKVPVVDANGTVWCDDCAKVHSIANTAKHTCHECGGEVSTDELIIHHNKRAYHIDCAFDREDDVEYLICDNCNLLYQADTGELVACEGGAQHWCPDCVYWHSEEV